MENKMGNFRVRVEKLLEDIPKGRRIHIDKKALEGLIFTTVVYDKEENKSFKLPTWTGPFLEKIDLSELDFEDVAWSMLVADYDEVDSTYIDEDVYVKLMSDDSYVPSGYVVMFSNTNANIDFTKSFEAKTSGSIKIVNCCFDGTDLSNNDFNTLSYASNSNFSKTGLRLPTHGFMLLDCDLSDNDLSYFLEDAVNLVGDFTEKSRFKNCRLTNTGMRVRLDFANVSDMAEVQRQNFEDEFMTYLSAGCLDHCYVNNDMILSKEDRKNTVTTRENFENDLLLDIKEQISSLKK